MNKTKLLLIFITFFIMSETNAQKGKNKKLPVKEKKIIETIRDITPAKVEDESRDADDDDVSDKSETSDNSDKSDTDTADENSHENPYYKVVIKNGVVLRDKPKLTGKKLLIIPEDTIGEILEETKEREKIENRMGNWLKVDYDGKLGWIFSGFTIIKEDKDDFLPISLIGYFLIKSKETVFYRKPGREVLGVMPEFPEKGDVVPVYRKKIFSENEYYYFELKSLKQNSDEILVGWVDGKKGNFLSQEAFSAYTLKSRKKKPKGIEKEIINWMTKNQQKESDAYNYGKIEIESFTIKEAGSKKKKAYIVGYPTGTKTKKKYGDYKVSYYLLWKDGDNIHTLLAGDKKFFRTYDIDKDGIPEVLVQFETKDEPPLCHIYVYKKGMFGQLFPNYIYCAKIKISSGNIEIQKDKEKITYKYSKGDLSLEKNSKPESSIIILDEE
ncbi:MAG: SH3 domain-containing protein [Leptospiraceae bacterium]|nr:SH3 domain-containing protein [Leptospiraceae bacterium]